MSRETDIVEVLKPVADRLLAHEAETATALAALADARAVATKAAERVDLIAEAADAELKRLREDLAIVRTERQVPADLIDRIERRLREGEQLQLEQQHAAMRRLEWRALSLRSQRSLIVRPSLSGSDLEGALA